MTQSTDHTMSRHQGSLRDVVAQFGRVRLRGWQGLVLVVVLASGLRFYGLGNRCFHGDEILSITIAGTNTMSELQRLAKPAWHPPLHYAIPRLLYLSGARTEFQWRIAGALFGALLAAATFLIALLWGSSRLSLPAGLLAATSPMGVLFSQTNRWHPLVAGMLALACIGLVIGLRRRAIWGWLLAGVCFALAFHTVYLAGVVAAVLMVLALCQAHRDGRGVGGWLSAALLGLVLIAPWVRSGAIWMRPGQISWEPVRGVVPYVGKLVLVLQNLAVGPTVLPWNWAVMIPAAILLAYLAWRFVTSSDAQVRSVKGAVFGSLLLCLPVLLLAPVTASSRYWLILLLPLHIGIAGGLVSITSRRVQAVSAVALAALVAYGLFNLYTQRQYQYLELTDDWRGMAEMVHQQAWPGDEVWSAMTPFVFYYGPEGLNVFSWHVNKSAVAKRLEWTGAERVFLEYSPLSGWEVISFARVGEVIGEELTELGFERQWRGYYGRDPDAATKRKYIQGRFFPQYRHIVELWVRQPR